MINKIDILKDECVNANLWFNTIQDFCDIHDSKKWLGEGCKDELLIDFCKEFNYVLLSYDTDMLDLWRKNKDFRLIFICDKKISNFSSMNKNIIPVIRSKIYSYRHQFIKSRIDLYSEILNLEYRKLINLNNTFLLKVHCNDHSFDITFTTKSGRIINNNYNY